MLSKQILNEFKAIIEEDYSIVLSQSETEQIANNLVLYFDLLKKIYHRKRKEEFKNLDVNRQNDSNQGI